MQSISIIHRVKAILALSFITLPYPITFIVFKNMLKKIYNIYFKLQYNYFFFLEFFLKNLQVIEAI